MTVRSVLINAPTSPVLFAERKDRINIELSEDELKAFITLHVNEEELKGPGRADLFKEMMRKLKDMGIVVGIKNNVLLNKMVNHSPVLVAEGIAPVNGEDAKIQTYELKEIKPETKEDGNVDHYELNLINRVAAGEWLGEKIEPTEGIPGKTVKGSVIKPARGQDFPLLYDRKTVREAYEDGKTVLYSLVNGAVHYDGDRISVSNHLEVDGNIDFRTGNIDFDGYLTVKGTIKDNFSVAARKDIEILGEYGIGSVKGISSNDGSIFLRGGIAGNNKAVIKSKKNIYTKFVADTTIVCDGSVHIGFYCLNSNIMAKEVILDSPRGQIIGGNIEAEIRVVASFIGSPGEKRTLIHVAGFDRDQMKDRIETLASEIQRLKSDLAVAKMEVSVYSNPVGLSREQKLAYEKITDRFYGIRDELKKLEEERKSLTEYIRAHGRGEISVLKKVYPNTMLQIGSQVKEISRPVMSTCFYLMDGEMKEL
jgi:uncharacterized protein (DUF342 family)